MSQPEFNPDEQYIVAYYKSGFRGGSWPAWLFDGIAIALFMWGLIEGESAIMFAGFGLIIGWRVYEQTSQPKFFRATRSVIEKYESRIDELSTNDTKDRS